MHPKHERSSFYIPMYWAGFLFNCLLPACLQMFGGVQQLHHYLVPHNSQPTDKCIPQWKFSGRSCELCAEWYCLCRQSWRSIWDVHDSLHLVKNLAKSSWQLPGIQSILFDGEPRTKSAAFITISPRTYPETPWTHLLFESIPPTANPSMVKMPSVAAQENSSQPTRQNLHCAKWG